MKGILRKNEDHYFFWSSDWDPDKGEGFVANTTRLVPPKLSLKNCEAIENGYDLDELASKTYREFPTDELQHYNRDTQCFKKRKAFIKGFQKALEILGDNRELIIKLNDLLAGLNSFKYQVKASYLHFDCEQIIKSLQQTEWDVEIEMGCVMGCQNLIINGENSVCCGDKRPKLDEDDCLILKRI